MNVPAEVFFVGEECTLRIDVQGLMKKVKEVNSFIVERDVHVNNAYVTITSWKFVKTR